MTRFGITSTLFRERPLGATELDAVARAGFTAIDIVASAGHFDIQDTNQRQVLLEAASRAGVRVGSVAVTVEAAAAALPVVADCGWPVLVARLGSCRAHVPSVIDNRALPMLLEKLLDAMPAHGCTLALQLPAARVLSPEDAVELLESFDDIRLGVCLDIGHAHLAGGAAEAAETLSGLIVTTVLHDNNARDDLHRAPGEGAIPWAEALTACWKTGFTGPWVIDLAADPARGDVVARAVGARNRLQAILEDLAMPMTFSE